MAASARLARAWSIDALRTLAAARLPRPVFDFYDGGAEDEQSLRANAAAFERVALVPRAFVDVSRVDTRCELLGAAAALPMAIAPMGAVAYAHRDGDLLLARAAAAAGIPYTLSTMSAVSIERLAQEAPGRLWFQAHLLTPPGRTLQLVARARDAGYEALMITADLPVGGKRERDLRHQLAMPFRLRARHVAAFAARPAWSLGMLRHGVPDMPNMLPTTGSAQGSSIGAGFDASFDWTALRAIRAAWPRRLIVKGLLHPADAAQAVEAGADAIVVSNHGGRQLDGAIAPLDALPAIVRAVGGRASVLLDGGIRRGRDVLKARALGAEGVLLGRSVLWGLCVAGQRGAEHALQVLREELVRSMQLCGVADLRAADSLSTHPPMKDARHEPA
jgi:(S)-mandelate dehydrogenase